MLKRAFTAYGLIFHSEWEIPELLESSGDPDVIIRIGEVPGQLDSFFGKPDLYQVNENEFLLKLEGIANFWVKDGKEIVIQPAPNHLDSEVRLYLLGTCLGVLLHQRGILALHASAIETAAGAVLFSGPSGVGKSTLMAAFLKRDYCMLADDVTGIVLDRNGCPIVLPAIPRTKLWADAVKHLGHDLNTLPRLRPSEEKYELGVRELFAHQPAPLHRIYLPTSSNKVQAEIIRLDNIGSFQAVLDNTYREMFLNGLDRRKSHFFLSTATANQAVISRVLRPDDLSKLDDLVKLIEYDFTGPAGDESLTSIEKPASELVGKI
ncbi:MAG: hypothetical protein A2Z16_06090 [Chloroflexi bacterium RBG_16_54_18]|nr:MAG: hypothetical protein A2Z16_06090 [Chloroflexi bacterium RBG_16_54_18]